MTPVLIFTVYAWVGLIASSALLVFLYLVAGAFGTLLYKRFRRIYSITVVHYWLERLEREGLRTFERAPGDGD